MPKTDSSTLELAAFLFLVGAIAKSAQLPLHTWLPDAMEGPTPVSALIHAATMVTAGVYLVGRLHPIYDVASYAHHTVAIIGAVTALFAASIAIVQTDIKRVLAYSTMSQIGYMFLAVGVGAYAAGFFHLLSHAFFKALLFMAAGNVIHAMNDEQDMRRYGGLWRQLRRTSISFLIGSLALVGVFPLVGFFSKEWILGAVFSKSSDPVTFWLWVIGFATAILTGFYTGRMWWISFWGRPSETRPVAEPQRGAERDAGPRPRPRRADRRRRPPPDEDRALHRHQPGRGLPGAGRGQDPLADQRPRVAGYHRDARPGKRSPSSSPT